MTTRTVMSRSNIFSCVIYAMNLEEDGNRLELTAICVAMLAPTILASWLDADRKNMITVDVVMTPHFAACSSSRKASGCRTKKFCTQHSRYGTRGRVYTARHWLLQASIRENCSDCGFVEDRGKYSRQVRNPSEDEMVMFILSNHPSWRGR